MTFIVNFVAGGYTIKKFPSWQAFAEWASTVAEISKVTVDHGDE